MGVASSSTEVCSSVLTSPAPLNEQSQVLKRALLVDVIPLGEHAKAIAPPTKERIVKALQAGGEKALEEFLKNPYVNVVTAIIKEWQKVQ